MTTKRQRKKVVRQLPPVGTTLTGRSKGQTHTAVIVEAEDRPGGRAVKYGDQVFPSLSAPPKPSPATPRTVGSSGAPSRTTRRSSRLLPSSSQPPSPSGPGGWLSLKTRTLVLRVDAPIRRFSPNIRQIRPLST